MVSASCGYQGGDRAYDLLVSQGPSIWVDVGFDPNYKPTNRNPPHPGISRIEGLIDTGAEEGCIDSALAQQLGLPVVDRRQVCGIQGSAEVDVFLAQIHVPALKFTLHGPFAGVHLGAGGFRYDVLLGRTFLRYCRMEYDGPSGAVTISLS